MIQWQIEIHDDGIALTAQKYRRAKSHCLELIGLDLNANLQKEAPVDTGRLAGSFNNLRKISDDQYVTSSNADYAEAVQEGRKPGHAPPFEPIARWAKRHGLPAGAVWRKIWQKGIKPNPFVDRAIDAVEPRIAECWKIAMRDLVL